jgi:hypothetical protein
MYNFSQIVSFTLADLIHSAIHIAFWKLLIGVILVVLGIAMTPEGKRGTAVAGALVAIIALRFLGPQWVIDLS